MSIKKLETVFYWIKQRCEYKKHNRYKNYWWRWIKCLWESKEEFIKDMQLWYKEWLTINRIDNDWNYCKSNCERATQKKQQNNRTNNIYITYKWETKTIRQRSEILWYKRWILESRYRKWWDDNKIIETPRFTKTIKRKLSEAHKEKISKSMIGKNKKQLQYKP